MNIHPRGGATWKVNITQGLRDNKAPHPFRMPALSLYPQSGSADPNRARLCVWHSCPRGSPGDVLIINETVQHRAGVSLVDSLAPGHTMPRQNVPIQGLWEMKTAWGNERQQLCLPVEPEPWKKGTKDAHPCQLWHPDISHSATCCTRVLLH